MPRYFLRGAYARFGKRMVDIAFVLLLLPIAIPVVAFSVIALLATGASPFYVQPRIGRRGKVFQILKLRTMHPDADARLKHILEADSALCAEWTENQKLRNDPRITWVGRYLRRTSIDELPQLLNVLRGDMSLLGPRPMMPEQVALYGPTLPVYMALRPGISGLWQVTERNDANFAQRARIDADYAATLGFANDLRLVWKTIRVVLRSTGF
ncbi:sugar transferase [Roseinatronobacter alkalisoli]|uniref:Sugar transferase n=1 Tax=Roseinatronobacter alkalisoli TaxID=3028235 RepID=A0ABT5T462_9RHOB|nr:sugar transferase [Roseinatronobacter sp. HJB301]MDD7969771.1 sugar transferase [Roseinatronobacter sp. HJB301]